ncbi:hypothetical protein EW026_g5190 [Hermanssonia centrifuga]|uniref:Hydrophobin n=1 Tax=Hermanssonia centrifuga TaxID=98765 RepID=A0A4S4KF96_9APHY|nr:hypothetical protein EW026_g5190 [Hermanssonia centrifuga]
MLAHAYATFVYALLSLSVLAVATPWGAPPPVTVTVTATAPAVTETTVSQCNTGSIQCCNQVVEADSAEGAKLLSGLLGIILGPITGLLGVDCSPISVVGIASGNACSASPVCCENNSVGGLINIGCVPITL